MPNKKSAPKKKKAPKKEIPPYEGGKKMSAYFSYPKNGQHIPPIPRVQQFEGTVNGIPAGKFYSAKLHVITDIDYPQDEEQRMKGPIGRFSLPAVVTTSGLTYIEVFDEEGKLAFTSREVPYYIEEEDEFAE